MEDCELYLELLPYLEVAVCALLAALDDAARPFRPYLFVAYELAECEERRVELDFPDDFDDLSSTATYELLPCREAS